MKPLFLALLCAAATAFGESDFDAGNSAYDKGNYLEARQHYEAAVSRGEWSANLFYNLGNADEKIGATGLAILNYERALALDPRHSDAAANLKFLREQSLAKVPQLTWKERLFSVLPFDGWVLLASVAFWVAVLVLCGHFTARRRLTSATVFGMVLVVCAAAYAAVAAWRTAAELDAGVIVTKQAEARRGPADRAAVEDVLPAGSRVRVISVRGEWTYCALPGGQTGWVPSSAVERIRLSS